MVAILKIAVLVGLLASAYSEDQPEDGTHVTLSREQSGPAAPRSSTMTNRFCEAASGLICPKGNVLQIGGKDSKFTPVPYLCLSLCVRDNDCRNAHWGADRMCTIKDESCADDELIPGSGTDFSRLPRGESCPAERPEYVKPAEMYTTTFCAMYGKKCPGHNMYNKPQNIRPWIKCLMKCLGIVECASVDFVGDKCIINDYHCPDEELVDAEPGDINFMRLPKGYSGDGAPGCPSNRAPAPSDGGPIPPVPEQPAEGPADAPEEPSADAPEEPSADAPEEPSADAPEEPPAGASEEPPADAPEEPSADAPEEPSADAPEEPSADAPEEPSADAPEEPSAGAPEEPPAGASEEPSAGAPPEPPAETEPTTPAPCLCPCNATQDADGKCQCDAGFVKEGDKCVPDCPV